MLALSLLFVVLSLRIAEGLGAALQMPLHIPGAVSSTWFYRLVSASKLIHFARLITQNQGSCMEDSST